MSKPIRILAAVAGVLALAPPLAALGAIALSRPQAPPPLATVAGAVETIRTWVPELPAYGFLTARDGTRLGYQVHRGRPGGGVAVAVPGSTGVAASMHGVGRALAAAGVTVYAVDLRGHGESGPAGDIGYRGQLEDDMADLLALVEARHPGERRLLAGHSLGGAFALRIAQGPLGRRFDAYLATAPFLSQEAAVSRPDSGGWAHAAVPRILAIRLLSRVGIAAFDGLPVIAYAVAPDAPAGVPRTYSDRLLDNMSLPRDWRAALGRIDRPTAVLIGAGDEMFLAPAYASAIGAANPRIAVETLAGADHMGLIVRPEALERVAAAARGLLDRR